MSNTVIQETEPAVGICQSRIDAITRTLRIFHPPGSVIEIRCLDVPNKYGKGFAVAGYFDDISTATQKAYEIDTQAQPGGIYFVLNEFDSSLLARSPNALKPYPKHTTTDGDILRRRWLLIDIDPKRPSGIGSNEAQLEASRVAAERVREFLMGMNWSEPITANSGNGTHLLFPINLPNDEPSKKLIAAVLNAIDAKFSSNEMTIDTTVSNASRITKLYGTMARKGAWTDDRPHRRSELASVPDYLNDGSKEGEVVSVERLESVAKLAQQTSSTLENPASQQSTRTGYARLMVDDWLTESGVEFHQSKQSADGRTMWPVVNACQDGHGGRDECVVMQHNNGRMSFKCQHDSCREIGWQQIKTKIGAPQPHHFDPPLNLSSSASKAKSTTTSESSNKSKTLEAGTMVYAGDKGNIGTIVSDNGDSCTVHFVSPEGVQATKELSKSLLSTKDGTPLDEDAAEPVHIELIPSHQFATEDYHQRYLVRNILVADQPAIVGGRSKTMKTSLMIDLALSMGTGTPFLGEFHAEQCAVAILSGESGEFTVQETARRISEA